MNDTASATGQTNDLPQVNQQIHLVTRPKGEARVEDFALVHAPMPAVQALQEGQVLVQHHYLSLDPYMRGRMNDSKSYAAPQPLNAVMIGGTAGRVLASQHPAYAAGDAVVGMGGWQQYSVVDARQPGALMRVDAQGLPLSVYLGAAGMPGITAWYGLRQIIAPRAGQTIVVSAASGAVGSVVGQLAKLDGCRVVGIAGGPQKCSHVVEDLGFDACIDYRAHADLRSLAEAIKVAAPNGVDGVFENVGGMLLDAVMLRMNAFGRIALCGMIAGYEGQALPMLNPALMLVNRLRVQGFIVSEHLEFWPQAGAELQGHLRSGRLHYHETIAQGLAEAPQAFLGLLHGRNLGKQLVRLV